MKKHLFLIGGTMGVGKTTVCRILRDKLDRAVFLDGDWCWDASPFVVNEETKAMVQDNITHLLKNFLGCSAYANVIFCWVMHEQSIIDEILRRVDPKDAEVHTISLTACREALSKRLQHDIETGCRSSDIIGRSTLRLPLYESLNTEKIDTSDLSPEEIADRILALTANPDRHLK